MPIEVANLRRDAYRAVDSSLGWLKSLAKFEDGRLSLADDYTKKIGGRAPTGDLPPMLIAEYLMASLNSREKAYRGFQLARLGDKEIGLLAQALLAALEEHKCIGWPYVRPAEGREHPIFTDCVNYVLGAISKTINLSADKEALSIAPELRARLLKVGANLVKWLFENKIQVELDDVEMSC